MQTPEWSVSGYAQYVVPVKDYGFVTFSANYSWQDEYFSNTLNTELYIVESRSILDARIVFETANGNWFLDVYGKNLTDERYYSSKLSQSGSGGFVTPDMVAAQIISDGLNVGVRLGYRF